MNMSTHCAHRNTNYGHVKNEIGPRDERAADKRRELLVFASEQNLSFTCREHARDCFACAVPSTKRTNRKKMRPG